MIYFLFAFLALVLILVAVAKAKASQGSGGNGPWPFVKREFLTGGEKRFYAQLLAALPEYRVFPQVALSQLIDVKKGVNRMQWGNKIDRLVADFVVMNQAFEVVGVIELDGPHHSRPAQKERDARKDKALTVAGIQINRIDAGKAQTANDIRALYSLPPLAATQPGAPAAPNRQPA
ncbi:DUF2726 domain-containing protein [Chitinimonas sp.]|uniref:DUF2726 domain-containing protein n=1 Tax=Chitinimonas sp. TaxID=1934313 RepID=UPI0035AF065C